MIIVRTLRRDIAKYNKIDDEVCLCIVGPHHMRSLHRCGLLLRIFLYLGLCVCLFVLITIVNPVKQLNY